MRAALVGSIAVVDYRREQSSDNFLDFVLHNSRDVEVRAEVVHKSLSSVRHRLRKLNGNLSVCIAALCNDLCRLVAVCKLNLYGKLSRILIQIYNVKLTLNTHGDFSVEIDILGGKTVNRADSYAVSLKLQLLVYRDVVGVLGFIRFKRNAVFGCKILDSELIYL